MLMGGWTTLPVVLTASHSDKCLYLCSPWRCQVNRGDFFSFKSKNFSGFSFNSHSLSLMTWEIALGELVALSIPLTGGWILKSETVGWVAAQLWWWVQPINFDGCNFAEKAMGVGMTGRVVVSRHEQVSTELWGKDPGALNSKKFRQNWFWDQNEIASPWELVEQIMLDLSLKTWGCSCIIRRLPENKPKETILHSTATHLGWLAAHFFTSLPCGLKRHTHVHPHAHTCTHTLRSLVVSV